jgi:hydroxyacylglutathione hydrolase
MPEVVTIETPGLGDRSYVAHDGEVAVVVDPQRDTDRVDAVVDALGLRVAMVLETHIHNDYVTGGLALARSTGATYVVSADDEVAFERKAARDGDRYEVGRMVVSVIHTPGHTPNHLSFAVGDADGEASVVFTGGSMLFGAVGRTDLISPERTEELTRAQYRSVRRLADELPDDVAVYPTHGFGSFCSASKTTGESSTIATERNQNVALTTEDEDRFVNELLAGLAAYPSYYAHMSPANAAGPAGPDLSPPTKVDPAELRRRIDAGEWVVDLRNRVAFARDHVTGTISIEITDPFATYLGWTMPWGQPLTVIGTDPGQIEEAQRQLCRIGVDHLAGQAVGEPSELGEGRTGSYRTATFADLAEVWGREGVTVLDVRRPDEWEAGHLEGVANIPLWEIEARSGEVPPGEVWVHCASGFRSSIGSSLLARTGREVVYIDDDWDNAEKAGLPMAS